LRNFYDMLSVPADAPADEIKKAFRREIARYHPDKVQHLGQEFQEMASGIAADLTEAYRILMDPGMRAKYNEDLFGRPAADAAPKRGPALPPTRNQSPRPRARPLRRRHGPVRSRRRRVRPRRLAPISSRRRASRA
jgi:DnaJ-class molecular chaperone